MTKNDYKEIMNYLKTISSDEYLVHLDGVAEILWQYVKGKSVSEFQDEI